MANSWLRLWHDMPNDPKWRTIARISEQPLPLVLSVYMHLLVDASRNVTRGHTDVTPEDLASALDVTEEAINAVLSAMEGRVKEGNRLTGWDKRQPKREDSGDSETGAKSAAERKREQRERVKLNEQVEGRDSDVTKCHDASRNVPLDKDKDKDKEEKQSKSKTSAAFALPDWIDKTAWDLWMQTRKGKKMIPAQMQAQVNKLQAWKDQGVDYASALAASAEAGWAGLFEPKMQRGGAVSSQSENNQIREAGRKRLFGEQAIETI